jgi:hypothetical protein
MALQVEILYRSEAMKVDTVASPVGQTSATPDMPLIKAEDIKSILYLGIKGDLKLDTGSKHAVDTYA